MKLLLAVSGGIDSMYMAEHYLRAESAGGIAVAHCNFCLRGEESDADEAFVSGWCSDNGVTFHSIRFDTVEYARSKGISIEMAARELRYSWFARLCRENGYSATAVAHNADDNAETLMLNLLRGTGGRGMRGMQAQGRIPGDEDICLLRPLLGISRSEISAWMQENGKSFRTDSTNAENEYKRNKIRNKVFPLFREINPSFLTALNKDMDNFRQENDIAEDYFQQSRDKVLADGRIDLKALLCLMHWEYVLFRLTEPLGLNAQNFESLKDLLAGGGQIGGKTFYGEGCRIVTTSDYLVISRTEEEAGPDEITVEAPGEYIFNGKSIRVELADRAELKSLRQPQGTLALDASKLGFPFKLRNWHSGDWMKPLGLGGSKKLSDLFTDLKFSITDKEKAVVLEPEIFDNQRVAALIGHRIDDYFKISESTTVILIIQ